MRYERQNEKKRKKQEAELKRKKRRTTKVNVSYSITYVTHFPNDRDYQQTKGGLIRDIQYGKVDIKVNQIGQEFCENQVYETKVINVLIETEAIPLQVNPLEEERMYSLKVNYHYLNVEHNQSNDLCCVYNFILEKYGKHLKKLTRQKLMEIFEEEDDKNGVTTIQLEKFCKKHSISMFALDMDMKVFRKYHPDPAKRNHNLPALVFLVASNHLYPVEDTTLRNKIFGTEKAKDSNYKSNYKRPIKKQTFDSSKEVLIDPSFKEIPLLKNVNVVFTCLVSLLPLMKWLFKREQTVYESNSYNGQMLRIYYKDNVDIQINHDYKEALECSKKLSIPFRNQNLIQLGMESFRIYIEDDKVKSTFNSETLKVFLDYKKTVHTRTFYIPKPGARLVTLDIQKCHTSAFSFENDYKWCVFNLMDEVEVFKGELKDGCFYVETENEYPLKRDGWYMRGVLEYCKKVGIDFKIKYQIIPSHTLPSNYFLELVQRIFQLCPKEAKIMLNCLFGSFNKKVKNTTTDWFSSSLNEAALRYTQDPNSVYFQCHDCPGLYHISSTKTTKLFEYLIPFYWQILDNEINGYWAIISYTI